MSREDAYEVVQRNALRGLGRGLPLRGLLEVDPDAARALDEAELDRVFDLDGFLRHVDDVFDRTHRAAGGDPCLTIWHAPHEASGKVRELYRYGDTILMVASDRISAFDVVMPTPIPHKGRVLTALSRFWFDQTARTSSPTT